MASSSAQRLGGRYEVRSLIGRGGMAQVHLGFDTRLSRVVAIKMLRVDLARDAIFQARFRREAQAAASLNHPNIVGVYDTGEENVLGADGRPVSVPYIVMEYIEGHTVKELLGDGTPVPIDEAVEISAGILSALEYSHHAGLVHRDIKPGNVMLTNDGKVKVMDFGIARAMTDSQATMTATNAVVGTAQYLSPEQARGEQVDERSDIYSAGCVLFELLTGRPPFVGDSAVSVAYQHVSETVPVPSSIAADIPESLDRVTLKAMAKNPEDRYASASLMRIDMIRAVQGQPVDAPATATWSATAATVALDNLAATRAMAPTGTSTMAAIVDVDPTDTADGESAEVAKKKKRRNAWITFFVVLALVLVGIVVFMLVRGQESKATISVPDVAGMTYDEAAAKITEAGLVPVEGKQETSADVPAGDVTSTSPTAETLVEPDTEIKINTSTGPSSVTIPDVTGYSLEEARAKLEESGLVVTEGKEEYSATIDAGAVTSTSPAAGKPVSPGASVAINVSKGKEAAIVPDMAGMNEQEATAAINAAGLVVGDLTSADSASVESGKFVSSNPSPGSTLQPGQTVNLVFSNGKVTIPDDLVGRSQDGVLKALADLNLDPSTRTESSSEYASGVVIRVEPGSGTSVDQRSSVIVVVSSGPTQTQAPESTPTTTPAG